MLVGIFEFNFLHIFHFLIVRMFVYAGVRFSLTTDFPQPASKLSIWVSREIYFGHEQREAAGVLGRDSQAAARELGQEHKETLQP